MEKEKRGMGKINMIIVHGGAAHRDDFLVASIALAELGVETRLVRRDPTEEELEDPGVLVLDVGGRLEPEKGNFDHHQFPKEAAPACALSLYLEARGEAEAFGYMPWYEFTKVLDSKGPHALARSKGWAALPEDMKSPIENTLLKVFGGFEEVPVDFKKMMAEMARLIIKTVHEMRPAVERALGLPRFKVKGLEVILNEDTDTFGLQEARDKLVREGHDVAISVSWDDRGKGWALYRFNDHEAVDFSVLKDDERILFAHPGGFIAKTKERLSLDEVKELLEKAIRS